MTTRRHKRRMNSGLKGAIGSGGQRRFDQLIRWARGVQLSDLGESGTAWYAPSVPGSAAAPAAVSRALAGHSWRVRTVGGRAAGARPMPPARTPVAAPEAGTLPGTRARLLLLTPGRILTAISDGTPSPNRSLTELPLRSHIGTITQPSTPRSPWQRRQ